MATQTASERFAGAMENLILLADTMQQATALISGDEDGEEAASRSSSASFMNVVPLGNVVCVNNNNAHSLCLSMSQQLLICQGRELANPRKKKLLNCRNFFLSLLLFERNP